MLTRYKKKTREPNRRAWKERALDGLLMIHAFTAYLCSATGRIHKLQTSGSGHADSGVLETPQRVA